MNNKQTHYLRFSLFQQVEHWVLTLSFTILAVTGLPQRYPLSSWSETIINGLGGLEAVRIIHRVSAIVMVILFFLHIVEVGYKMYVKRYRLYMLPGIKDATDAINYVGHSLGIVKTAPKMPRYNFAEKAEYWALIWGTILMTVTGFILWNPITSTKFLPGEFIPAAKTAHSAEALLAALAILIWHVYWVHLKSFNKAMFTGKMSRQQMAHEHAAELEVIEAGGVKPPKPLSTAESSESRRKRIFTPIAAAAGLVMLIGLYFFTNYESTAIETVPPAEPMQAYVRATATPTYPPTRTPVPTATSTTMPTPADGVAEEPAVAAEGPPAEVVLVPQITHALKGREDCFMCHGSGKPMPFPENHTAYAVENCVLCHSTEAPVPGPKPVLHSISNRAECTQCHQSPDLVPATHVEAALTSDTCLNCHASASGDKIPPKETVEAAGEVPIADEASSSSALPPIPHTLKGRDDCLLCHATGKPKPFPESHVDYALDSCVGCHGTEIEPSTTVESAETEEAAPKETGDEVSNELPAIPHTLKGRDNCLLCHDTGKPKAFPANHVDYALDSCVGCHGTETEASTTVESAETEEAAPKEMGDEASNALPVIPHTLKGRDDCLLCHATGKPKAFPANHVDYALDSCVGCHGTETGASTTVESAETEEAAPKETGDEASNALPVIPHTLKGRDNCLLCHDTGKPKAFPANHVDYALDSCVGCHGTETETEANEAGESAETD